MNLIKDDTEGVPCKRIVSQGDVVAFKRSESYMKIRTYLLKFTEKIRGYDVPDGVLDLSLVTKGNVQMYDDKSSGIIRPSSLPSQINDENKSCVDGLLYVLNQLNNLIDQTPPRQESRRFGNLSCRDWHDKMNDMLESTLTEKIVLSDKESGHSGLIFKELTYYLSNAFGSRMRLDYGTGHELSFFAFFIGLIEVGALKFESLTAQQILTIFSKYFDLARRLILLYNLEPAGSHGVWGLDDHFHLIYILGAAQFNASSGKMIPPVKLVLQKHTIELYRGKNLYVNAISFIFKIKSGPFHEHSPIIYDIHSTVSLWSKVCSGLIKMYDVEVLGKFPVVQHFWFGRILFPWIDCATKKDLPYTEKANIENDNINLMNVSNAAKNSSKSVSITAAPWASGLHQRNHLSTNLNIAYADKFKDRKP